MITEKAIAREFHGLWSDTLPLLTPNFVRLFNAANSNDLTEYPATRFVTIPIGPEIEKHDLVAELSFQLAKEAHLNGVGAKELAADALPFKNAYQAATKFLNRYEAEDKLNDAEIAESLTITAQYELLFQHLAAVDVEFSPKISGAGYLGACIADLSVGDTLYEIKTVTRNIAGRDIKQLLIYLALQYSTGNRRWLNAGFFNPRRATHYKFSIDHLIYRTSGGRSTTEVFSEIVDFLLSRGIEIDTIF